MKTPIERTTEREKMALVSALCIGAALFMLSFALLADLAPQHPAKKSANSTEIGS